MRGKSHVVDLFFALALFGVFAVSALAVTVIGASVYRSTATQMRENDTVSTALTYLAEKIHRSDTSGSISLGQISGRDALLIQEELGGNTYITYIYEQAGHLRELMAEEGLVVTAEDGQDILELSSLSMEPLSDSLIRFSITGESGLTRQLTVALRT